MIRSDTRGDDEETCPDLGRTLDAAMYMFSRFLFDLEHQWEHLAAALGQDDVAQIEVAAKALGAAWSGACAAAQRIAARAADARAREQTARFALRAHGRALGDLVQRAMRRASPDAELHRLLHHLDAQLHSTREDRFSADSSGPTGTCAPEGHVYAGPDDDDLGSRDG